MMKQIIFYALAAGLALSAGCKKGEDGTTEMMSSEEMVEKTQAVAVQTTEKAAEVTAQAEAAVSAITVKAEDVMGDLNQSVEQIKEKVAAFDKTQVLAYADQYKNVLLEKKDQIADLTGQLKGLSMTEMMGDKAKLIKDQITLYSDQFAGLKDRYSIYLEKLESFGVDLSAYTL
jgi:predicted Zn-dependent protease with MMP-like domain